VPAPLVAIVLLTGVVYALGIDDRTVGDMGELPDTLPTFLIPDVPLSLETLFIILPYWAAIATVGLLESLMTANLVDELTDTPSQRNRECIGQGVANTATGFIGGMAGCAMIGRSIINVKSGGRARLSSLTAGVALLFMILVLADFVRAIPMAALVAVMIMVSIGTFSWSSLKNLRTHPRSPSAVMITVVVLVVMTHNLAIGVLAGVLLSGVFFAGKIPRSSASRQRRTLTAARGATSSKGSCSTPRSRTSTAPSTSRRRWTRLSSISLARTSGTSRAWPGDPRRRDRPAQGRLSRDRGPAAPAQR
jgi:SulP family sulfate permease